MQGGRRKPANPFACLCKAVVDRDKRDEDKKECLYIRPVNIGFRTALFGEFCGDGNTVSSWLKQQEP